MEVSMNIGAVVVVYNPDFDLLRKNIDAILSERVECVVLVNNSRDVSLEKLRVSDKIQIINEKENVGIAKALNDGIKYLDSRKFKYVLTMDQDSIIQSGSVEKLYNAFDKKAAICGCLYVDRNRGTKKQSVDIKEEVKIIITSGNLLKISAWKSVGGFEEKLFIDCVDFDICLKLRKKGYKIFQINDAILSHSVGDVTPRRLLFLKRYPSNHSSFRVYYIFRNNIYMIKKWFFREPILMLNRFRTLINRTIDIILFEKKKIGKIKMIFKGFIVGLFFRVKK